MEKSRIKWLDIAKTCAILAVMVNHSIGILYTNQYIAYASYFSVSIFIIVMGITTVWSYENSADDIITKVKSKCLGIFIPYLIASFIHEVVLIKAFDFELFVAHIIRFDICAPYYYVLLYMQLVLVSPLIYYALKKTGNGSKGILKKICLLCVVVFISSVTTCYTNILGVYGGGGKLFGGTYLVLLYIGMWFGLYCRKLQLGVIPAFCLLMLSFVLTVVWYRVIADYSRIIDSRVPFGDGINPPSISFGLYSILVVLTLYFGEYFINYLNNARIIKMLDVFAYLGKHTLYIFLYHRLYLDIIIPRIGIILGVTIDNIWIKRVVYFCGMICGSIIIELLANLCTNYVRNAYVKTQ